MGQNLSVGEGGAGWCELLCLVVLLLLEGKGESSSLIGGCLVPSQKQIHGEYVDTYESHRKVINALTFCNLVDDNAAPPKALSYRAHNILGIENYIDDFIALFNLSRGFGLIGFVWGQPPRSSSQVLFVFIIIS